jgi:DNA modification methylase
VQSNAARNQKDLFLVNEQQELGISSRQNLTERSEWGTFKDSLRAPIHNWFPYPAGFSNRAVAHAFDRFGIHAGSLIYDPFSGAGTTNIVAKEHGFDSIGVEAHPFIFFVARTKIQWDYDLEEVLGTLEQVHTQAHKMALADEVNARELPPLIHSCYESSVLKELVCLREAVKELDMPPKYADLHNLALTCILRPMANVATGWPYIAPNKKKKGKDKNAFREHRNMVLRMYQDVQQVCSRITRHADCQILNSDARSTDGQIPDASVDFIFTSPPYLNNFDYADRTRLETYFFKLTNTWADITEKVRTKLIMSATTQINRGERPVGSVLSSRLRQAAPGTASLLQEKINKLSEIRLTKGGKKSYDILTGGYFSDMFEVLSDCFRIMKTGSQMALILGDSAPYGVHIPTDIILGDLGMAVGFAGYDIEELRRRGGKWKDNPQRHSVPLRESILLLRKE